MTIFVSKLEYLSHLHIVADAFRYQSLLLVLFSICPTFCILLFLSCLTFFGLQCFLVFHFLLYYLVSYVFFHCSFRNYSRDYDKQPSLIKNVIQSCTFTTSQTV